MGIPSPHLGRPVGSLIGVKSQISAFKTMRPSLPTQEDAVLEATQSGRKMTLVEVLDVIPIGCTVRFV